jgi:phosphatidylserine/phosphatidylglycerophosphate/cardiolipin synthase-like enzyme
VNLLILVVLGLAFLFYRTIGDGPLPIPTSSPSTPTSGSADWWSVYFTDPLAPNADSLRGGPDATLAAAIDSARLSVDVAAYDLDLWSLRDALIEADRRGVAVRMVTESDNLETREIQDLVEAGIEVLGDRREGLMHDKFTVIDRLEVWTGSMNYTVNDGYRNNNNLVRVRSTAVAEDYTAEFEEMFVEDRFGPGSPANTPDPRLTVNGTPVEIYFSPDDGVAARLLELIQGAEHSIYFLAYSFTSDGLADAMLERLQAGVTVSGVLESNQVNSNQGGEFERLRTAGMDIHLDGNPRSMHHKVIIIDERITITGSYNFSNNAEKVNDENVIIFDSPHITAWFLDEFKRLYAGSKK